MGSGSYRKLGETHAKGLSSVSLVLLCFGPTIYVRSKECTGAEKSILNTRDHTKIFEENENPLEGVASMAEK